jgi:excisionase family DNA binding protein
MNSFISTKEAAQRLKISVRRVQALISAGRLPAEKIGNSYAINPVDLSRLNGRKNGRASKTVERSQDDWNAILDKILGCVALGPRDLATNKKYMEGFGRDNAYRR